MRKFVLYGPARFLLPRCALPIRPRQSTTLSRPCPLRSLVPAPLLGSLRTRRRTLPPYRNFGIARTTRAANQRTE